jgi:hypothetical protein
LVKGALQWGGNLIKNPVQTIRAFARGVELNREYGVDLTADHDAQNWLEWSPEQVNAVYDSTTKTNNALSHVIANDHSPSAPFTETVGPVEIRLREEEGVQTVWRPEQDNTLIQLPQDFMELEGDNQDGGEWLVTGEYFVAADHRSFGKMSELLGATGIIHNGEVTSGNRGNTTDWVYDEHGIFDYSGLGGPRNSSRENYHNDTHHHELSDMGKQWVFLNDLAQRYDSEVDLLHEIRNQQTTIPPELHPSELEMLRERLDDPAYHVDRIRMAYRLGGLDGAITTGLNDFMEQHRHLSPAVYEAMLEEKIETATILSVNEQFRDILNAYDEHQTNLVTMMNRNADLESFLSIAHATSQQWRDPHFVQSIMQDNQSADAILQSLSEQDLSNHARLSESFNNNSLKNIFDAYTPLNTIDGDSWNPTTLYETTYNLHDTLTYLVASTDWANEITSNPRNTVNGSNLATVQANLPDEVVALSNRHLAYSITEDLTDEDRARLVDLMDAHAQQHGYQQVDPPMVENYNLNRVMIGGLIGVSIASEVLGDSIDLVSATLSGLRGDAVGVAADLSSILAPRALGYLDDFVQGGRRLVGEVVDAERRTGEWLEGFFRRQFVDGRELAYVGVGRAGNRVGHAVDDVADTHLGVVRSASGDRGPVGPRQWQHTGVRKQAQSLKRGWTDQDIQNTLDNPVATLPAPRGNLATGNSATIYYRKDGHYIIRDDVTGDIVQYSNTYDSGWLDEGTNNTDSIKPRGE